MICYYYPPVTDVGSKRSIAFSKYFKKHGWNPVVLSVTNPDRNYCTVGDARPPEGVETHYAHSLVSLSWILGKMNGALSRVLSVFNVELKRNYFHDLLCYPDLFMGWIPLATLEGVRLARRRRVDAIYVSCSPFSGALVGVLLKKLTRRPLVLDFRDPFVTGVLSHFTRSRVRKTILSWFERSFVRNADLLLLTSEETRAQYAMAYSSSAEKMFTVYNGFDPVQLDEGVDKFEKFTIIYTGQFYQFGAHHQVYTELFFNALAHLKSGGNISAETFQFLFFGDEHRFIAETARAHGVADLVASRSRVPYREALAQIRRSHLMLLRIVKLMISTKLFEGIPLDVPFLATIPRGEVEDIIRHYSPGSYVVTEDKSHFDVAEAIRDAIAKYRLNAMPHNDVDAFFVRFSRERLTQQVMRLVEEKVMGRAESLT